MLKNITREMWDNEMRKYKGSCPNESNSIYEENLVNFYTCYDDIDLLENIESDTTQLLKEIEKSEFYSKVVKNLSYEIDDLCKIGFVDIFLNENVTYKDFKSFLEYIKNNFN